MRFDLDRNGSFRVKYPDQKNVAAIMGLAQTFVQHELSLPVAQRLLLIEPIQTRLSQLQEALAVKADGWTRTIVASAHVKTAEQRARELVRQMQRNFNLLFFERPAQATAWGFTLRQTGKRAGTLLLPVSRDETVQLLATYASHEQSRPTAERFTVPALGEVIAVHAELVAQVAARHVATAVREAGRADSLRLAADLLVHLQVALAYLMVTRFNSKLTPDLQAWGFNIVERRAARHETETTPNVEAAYKPIE